MQRLFCIPGKPTQIGFTLLEVLIVLVISAILLTLGIPELTRFTQRQRVQAAANDFLLALESTRTQAIQRASRVDMAPWDGQHWENGWVIYISHTGQPYFSREDSIISSYGALSPGIQVTSALSDASAQYIAYNSSGRSQRSHSEQAPQFGSWQFALGEHIRLVKVGFLGRARLCDPVQDVKCQQLTIINK